METKKELRFLLLIVIAFIGAFFLPIDSERFNTAVKATFDLTKWYAREHVILCLLPAFFIAGVISVFVSQGSVLKYFGANAKKWLAYSVAAVSGTILSVCSCTILPLFSSIHKRGAGLGPAVAFLYSGPAINILAIILTARILGFEMGVARIIGALVFSVVIGVIMSLIYRKEEQLKRAQQMNVVNPPDKRPIWQTSLLFFTLILIMVFANWGRPATDDTLSSWYFIWANKWYFTGLFSLLLAYSLIYILKIKWHWVAISVVVTAASVLLSIVLITNPGIKPLLPVLVGFTGLSVMTLLDKNDNENREWAIATWGFARQIMPLLAIGVITAGFLLGSTHDGQTIAGIIPNEWIKWLVGGNSLLSNFFAALVGAFMYFATLTEVPILQGLIATGMGKGPALALLLAGPALSLPNMLIIRTVMGSQKTFVYIGLVVVMATASGLIFGAIMA